VFSGEGVATPFEPTAVAVDAGASAGEVETEAELFGIDSVVFSGE
jgi:hypothetical protein